MSYALYKNDWQQIDDIEDVTVYPLNENGEIEDSLKVENVKAHVGNLSEQQLTQLGVVATESRGQGFILFVDTMSEVRLVPRAVVQRANGEAYSIENYQLAIFDTRYLAFGTELVELSVA